MRNGCHILGGLQRTGKWLAALLACACIANTAGAAIFVVNSTGDAGDLAPGDGACDTGGFNSQGAIECTLRAAIEEANLFPGADNINFNMPVTEPGYSPAPLSYTTQPASALPPIAQPVFVDGRTQPDFPGTPVVVVDGTLAGASDGLVVGGGAGGTTIRSLVVQNFVNNGMLLLGAGNTIAGNYVGLGADGSTIAANNTVNLVQQGGIRIESAGNTIGGNVPADRNVLSGNFFAGIVLFGAVASGNEIYGNYIGVDAGGTLDRGNDQEGIDLQLAGGNTIGGPGTGEGNVLSGNGSDGIEIDGGDFNIVQGNFIGTDFTGTAIIPNDRDGIDVNEEAGNGSTNTLIGGTGTDEGNLIRGNGIYGVSIRGAPAIDNSILGNRIYGNVALDIDLNNDGVTSNDPLDADNGSNDLLNFPVIVAAPEDGGTITAYFGLDVPAGDYRIEFFTNPSGTHASGNGGGEVFAGARTVSHAGAGTEYFAHSFAGSAGDVITATATEQLAGPTYASTSEFSTPFTATVFVPYTAWWPLDETSGTTAVDIDAGNNGTYRNGVLLNQLSACTDTGNAVYFDGVDDHVEVSHVAGYLMHSGTVAFWANVDATGANQSLFSKDSTDLDTGGHLTVSVLASGNVQVRLQSTTNSFFVTGAAVTAGSWFHVAFSWGAAGMALYVDGAAPVTDPYSGGLGITSGGTGNFEPIAFGASTMVSGDLVVNPLSDYLAGYMDEVRLYNRALSPAEIQSLATCPPNLNIVKRAFWPDGTPIPTGAIIPSNVEFQYLLYVNNFSVARSDVTLRDVLDPAFQYQAGTIKVDNSLANCAAVACTPAEEQAIFAAADAAAILTDAIDADAASYSGGSTSVDVGDGNIANAQLNANANAVLAVMFTAKMP